MAPKKRKNESREVAKRSQATTTAARVTRSMSRGSTRGSTTGAAPKLAQLEPQKRKKKKVEKAVKKEEDMGKDKTEEDDKQEEEKGENKEEGDLMDESKKRTIVIEHCKQCNSFKTRAIQVKKGLEEGVPGGIEVILNPDKPRRGCFEIREEGGETFISLLDMKRPFSPMKALDMEQVIADIIKKIE